MWLAVTGLPRSGKSTLMRALIGRGYITKKNRQSGQFIVNIPDPRIEKLAGIYQPKKITYSQINFLEIPALSISPKVFRSNLPLDLKQYEGIIQVICNFNNGLSTPTPIVDYQAFTDELILNDLFAIERRLEHISQQLYRKRKIDYEELQLCEQAKEILNEGKPLRWEKNYDFANHPKFKGFGLLTTKPLIIVVNNDEKNSYIPNLKTLDPIIVVQASIEADLAELAQKDRSEFMITLGLTELTVDRLIRASCQLLNFITFFTASKEEIRAWLVRQSTPVNQAAGLIHTDLKKGFIRAEIIYYEDLISLGSEIAVKKAGLIKLVSKEYLVTDGNIIHIRFNV